MMVNLSDGKQRAAGSEPPLVPPGEGSLSWGSVGNDHLSGLPSNALNV